MLYSSLLVGNTNLRNSANFKVDNFLIGQGNAKSSGIWDFLKILDVEEFREFKEFLDL